MAQKKIVNSAFSRAFSAWFSDYERTRKKLGRRRGSKIIDFPSPPASPDDVREYVDKIGTQAVIKTFQIHRTTLARWVSGQAVIPRPAWLLLVLMADGLLPGMSSDWSQFRFDGDRLHLIGTRLSYTALEIAGWQYQQAHAQALASSLEAAQEKINYLLRIGQFEAQNDALIHTG